MLARILNYFWLRKSVIYYPYHSCLWFVSLGVVLKSLQKVYGWAVPRPTPTQGLVVTKILNSPWPFSWESTVLYTSTLKHPAFWLEKKFLLLCFFVKHELKTKHFPLGSLCSYMYTYGNTNYFVYLVKWRAFARDNLVI